MGQASKNNITNPYGYGERMSRITKEATLYCEKYELENILDVDDKNPRVGATFLSIAEGKYKYPITIIYEVEEKKSFISESQFDEAARMIGFAVKGQNIKKMKEILGLLS